jgi:hypothetical protein
MKTVEQLRNNSQLLLWRFDFQTSFGGILGKAGDQSARACQLDLQKKKSNSRSLFSSFGFATSIFTDLTSENYKGPTRFNLT